LPPGVTRVQRECLHALLVTVYVVMPPAGVTQLLSLTAELLHRLALFAYILHASVDS
jgi:hypothetical protein